MAIAATTVIEVRATGSDQNGGGFNSARGGVDYSCQASPQASGTVTVSGTTCTATTAIFTSAMVGNLITDGTSWREITAYTSATVVTLDATVAWTSASIRVGGALLTLAKAVSIQVAGNLIWFSNNQTFSAQLAIAGNTTGSLSKIIKGYGTTRGDGVKPTITAAASTANISPSGMVVLADFLLDGADVAVDGIVPTGSSDRGMLIQRVHVTRTKGRGFVVAAATYDCCVAYSLHATATAGFGDFTGGNVRNCVARDLACMGFRISTSAANGGMVAANCVAARCTTGFEMQSGLNTSRLEGCLAHSNSSDGFRFANNQSPWFRDNIAWGNGGYGISMIANGTASQSYAAGTFAVRTAFGSNTSGSRLNLAASPDDITLTADPCANAAANDFRLNWAAGGGALLRNRMQSLPAGQDWGPIGPLHPWGVPIAGEAA